MAERNVKIVRGFKVPAKEGSHFRIMCMTGENKGLSYYLSGTRVIMGRGNTADIQVLDNKCSREHAELKHFGGTFMISDLGSQNGLTVNDLKIKQHKLKSGDKIIIGQTVFKFDHIMNKDLQLIEGGTKISNLDKLNEDSDTEDESDDDNDDELTEEEKADGEKAKKRILIILAIFGIIYMMLDSEEPAKKKRTAVRTGTSAKDSFAEALRKQQNELDQEQKDKLETIIHRGLRELREFNYSRAIEEFNLALVLSPNNGRAQFYLSKAEQRLYDEVDRNMIKARREEGALKYDAAVVSYCSVIRLLRKYPNHENYKDAEEEIKKLELKLGMVEGEINCLASGEF